jgi:preprotein translocase subunit Sss1
MSKKRTKKQAWAEYDRLVTLAGISLRAARQARICGHWEREEEYKKEAKQYFATADAILDEANIPTWKEVIDKIIEVKKQESDDSSSP